MFKFNLVKLERVLIYQPVYVSERLYFTQRNHSARFTSNGFSIIFGGNPELRNNEIYLGFRSSPSRYATYTFDSNEKRDEYYNKLMNAIKESIQYLKNV